MLPRGSGIKACRLISSPLWDEGGDGEWEQGEQAPSQGVKEVRESIGGAAGSVGRSGVCRDGVQVWELQETKPARWAAARSQASGKPQGGGWTSTQEQ